MKFEWDNQKGASNEKKHGISFNTAQSLWLDERRVEIEIAFPSEKRWALIASLEGKMWTAIYTIRWDVIRLISVRRARPREVGLYEDKTSG